MTFAFGSGYAPQACAANGGAVTGGFIRYKGDDWDGVNILRFQYGTLVKGTVTTNPDGTTTTAPDTIVPIDITGCVPVGTLLFRCPSAIVVPGLSTPAPSIPPAFTLTVAAGTARILDAPNGFFGFCPRSDITSQLRALSDCATMADATLEIAAKLIDTATPGNLGTIAKLPILVYQS